MVYDQIEGRKGTSGIVTERSLASSRKKQVVKPTLKAEYLNDADLFPRQSARASGDYFNPHPNTPYKKEIESHFQTNGENVGKEFRFTPMERTHASSSIQASRNYLPSPPHKASKEKPTPATAVESSFERVIEDTPPPIKAKFFQHEQEKSSEVKRPRPFSYFVEKSGAALDALRAQSIYDSPKSIGRLEPEISGGKKTESIYSGKKPQPKLTQDTPKASLSTEEQSHIDEDLFSSKMRLLTKAVSQRFE